MPDIETERARGAQASAESSKREPSCEASERAAVIAEARAWLGTPYHHMGRVKGAGVDCATLLAEVYARAGVIPPVAIPYYPPDWHLHRDAERYLGFVLEHAQEIRGGAQADAPDNRSSRLSPEGSRAKSAWSGTSKSSGREPLCEAKPKPADIALWKFGRCFSHGAIVLDWPLVIHAYAGKGCVLEDASRARWLAQRGERSERSPRPVKFFRLMRWGAPALETDSSEATARAEYVGPRLHAERK
ncbi:MAG TPA: hypothetical protein VGL83_16850 [Stellaceae bacterium]|jgi:cell wall-associated NlpC family hydrolase